MARSSRLVDQPNDQFPFNQKTYDRVTPPSPPVQLSCHSYSCFDRATVEHAAEANTWPFDGSSIVASRVYVPLTIGRCEFLATYCEGVGSAWVAA